MASFERWKMKTRDRGRTWVLKTGSLPGSCWPISQWPSYAYMPDFTHAKMYTHLCLKSYRRGRLSDSNILQALTKSSGERSWEKKIVQFWNSHQIYFFIPFMYYCIGYNNTIPTKFGMLIQSEYSHNNRLVGGVIMWVAPPTNLLLHKNTYTPKYIL